MLDCRVPISLAANQTIVDSTNGTITHAYTRTAAATSDNADERIILYTSTALDYTNAVSSGNVAGLDMFVADPIQDPCNLWKWTESDTGTPKLQAEDAIVYRVSHVPAVLVPEDNTALHYGFDECRQSCLADSQCVGASYLIEKGTNNTMVCKFLMDAGSIDESIEYVMFEDSEQGFAAANIQTNFDIAGIVSICEN